MMSGLIFYIWVFAHLVSAAALCYIVLPPVCRLLQEAGAEVSNYRQRNVISMAGITIAIVWLILIALAMAMSVLADTLRIPVPDGYIISAKIALPLTLLIVASTLFGFIDDKMGTREYSGFKGHIGALLKGKLTTGGLKAIGISIVSIIAISMFSNGLIELLGNALLIALTVNTLNLFDLRPGRALKVFIFLQTIAMLTAGSLLMTSSAALLGIAVVLVGSDLKEKIMLGDTGSNALGAALGLCLVLGFDWREKLPIIIILIFLQILTEKISISSVIERTAFLRYLDNIGRTEEGNKKI